METPNLRKALLPAPSRIGDHLQPKLSSIQQPGPSLATEIVMMTMGTYTEKDGNWWNVIKHDDKTW